MSLLKHWRGLNRLKTLDLYGRERQGVRHAAKSRSFRVVCGKDGKNNHQKNTALKEEFDILRKYTHLHPVGKLDEKIDTTLLSVKYEATTSRLESCRNNSPGSKVKKSSNQHNWRSLINTSYLLCLICTKNRGLKTTVMYRTIFKSLLRQLIVVCPPCCCWPAGRYVSS